MFLVIRDGTGWDSEEEALGARGPVQVFIQGTGSGLWTAAYPGTEKGMKLSLGRVRVCGRI